MTIEFKLANQQAHDQPGCVCALSCSSASGWLMQDAACVAVGKECIYILYIMHTCIQGLLRLALNHT